jgi:hypothetical protein
LAIRLVTPIVWQIKNGTRAASHICGQAKSQYTVVLKDKPKFPDAGFEEITSGAVTASKSR